MCHSTAAPEEEVSHALYMAAKEDDSLEVISWQAVNGKGYFTADIKLRLPSGDRAEPDLIVANSKVVWLIEVKALHSEAVADEVKLETLLDECSPESLLGLIRLHSGSDVANKRLIGAVAFGLDDLSDGTRCRQSIVHITWPAARKDGETLGSLLNRLERTTRDPSE